MYTQCRNLVNTVRGCGTRLKLSQTPLVLGVGRGGTFLNLPKAHFVLKMAQFVSWSARKVPTIYTIHTNII